MDQYFPAHQAVGDAIHRPQDHRRRIRRGRGGLSRRRPCRTAGCRSTMTHRARTVTMSRSELDGTRHPRTAAALHRHHPSHPAGHGRVAGRSGGRVHATLASIARGDAVNVTRPGHGVAHGHARRRARPPPGAAGCRWTDSRWSSLIGPCQVALRPRPADHLGGGPRGPCACRLAPPGCCSRQSAPRPAGGPPCCRPMPPSGSSSAASPWSESTSLSVRRPASTAALRCTALSCRPGVVILEGLDLSAASPGALFAHLPADAPGREATERLPGPSSARSES